MCISHRSGDWKSESKVKVDQFLVRVLLDDLQTLPPHCMLTGPGRRHETVLWGLLIGTPHHDLITSQRPLCLISVH